MPPFNPAAKIPKPPRPAATAPRIARAPWEREDDDEHGPPPALDLSPGDAEAEARRMIYDRKHPMHDAIVQGAHINHNHAMRRYTSLMRRAWDPAARNMPLHRAAIDTPGLADLDPLRMAGRTASTETGRSQTADPVAVQKQPKQASTAPTPASPPYQRPLPSQETLARTEAMRQIVRNTIDNIGGDTPLDPQIYADRAEGEAQAHDRGAAARRNDPDAGTPPHAINLERLADAEEVVAARDDFSDTTKYILLGLISYEDIVPDIAGGSFGGIDSDNFEALKDFVSEWRVSEGRDAITVGSAADLTLDELIDFQYAYLVGALEPTFEVPAKPDEDATEDNWNAYRKNVAAILPRAIAAFTARDLLDNLGPNVVAYQIADSVFNYGSDGRAAILQYAVNMTVQQMTPGQRAAGEYHLIEADGRYGSDTAGAIEMLANDPVHQRTFLDYLRLGRARWAWDHNRYTGNNRWRIWGVTRE